MTVQGHTRIPDLYQARRVLCVQPHYDDNDIAAGGTVAALRANDAQIIYLTVTDDLVGVIDPDLPDEAAAVQLKKEQQEAGDIIGVGEQYWLDYPDAGKYDYFELRHSIIKHIRMLQPDFVFTVDPWLPYEAHNDHRQVGLAVAEAVYLQAFKRLLVDPEIDKDYESYQITAIAFYNTHKPNMIFDISNYREVKHRAIDRYRMQFSSDSMANLHAFLGTHERRWAEGQDFSHAEALKVLTPAQLHGGRTVQLMMDTA